MTEHGRHDSALLRARLEFPIWYRSFTKSYVAWSNAPSDLKTPLLLNGAALAKAETWLISAPGKLTDSQKRFIVRSISQRAKEPATPTPAMTAARKPKWQWHRSSDRNLWQLYAVIALGFWVFAPDIITDGLERALNTPEAYEELRKQQQLAKAPQKAPSPEEGTQTAAAAADAADAPIVVPETAPAAQPAVAHPPALSPSARLAALAADQADAGNGRAGMLLAIEAAELALNEPTAADAAAPRLPPVLLLAIAGRDPLAPLFKRDAVATSVLFCGEARGLVAITGPAELTAWAGTVPGSAARQLRGISHSSLAAAALDRSCSRVLISNDDFNVEIQSLMLQSPALQSSTLAGGARLLVGHEAQITAANFSPDGSGIVTASQDSTARVWDARTGRQRAILSGHDWHVLAAEFSPDGRRILTAAADNTARIWDAASGRQILMLGSHQGAVTSARFSSDGSRVVTTSWDGFVRLFEAATGKLQATIRHPQGNLMRAALSRDGRRLATVEADGEAQLWDLATEVAPKQIANLPGNAQRVDFSPDNLWLAVHDWEGVITLHDAQTGEPGQKLTGGGDPLHAFTFGAYVSSSGAPNLVAISEGGTRFTWPLLANTTDAIAYAKTIAPACLTADERTLLGLDPAAPSWCSQIKPRGAALPH